MFLHSHGQGGWLHIAKMLASQVYWTENSMYWLKIHVSAFRYCVPGAGGTSVG